MSKTVWIINQYASTPDFGYAGRHYYLGKELAKRGYTVFLITSASHHLLRKKPALASDFELEEQEEGFTVVWVRMPHYEQAHSKGRILGWFLFSWRLRKLFRQIPDSPDVVVCSSPSLLSFLGAKTLARRVGAKLVFEVRDIWPMTLMDIGGYSRRHPFIRLMQWVEDKAYRDSDRVVSNLKNSVEHMVSRGMKREKFAWVPNGFSMDEVSLNSSLNARAVDQLPQDKFIVGYTGTLGVANSLYTLVDAAERLRGHGEIAFVLVGDGKERAALKKLVAKKGLDNVFFVDPIPKVEIQAILAKFDACYLGLSKDPLFRFGVSPNKLFDYLYSGKPIIYGIESGDYRPVEDAAAGIQIDAEDDEQLADATIELYQMSPERRAAMGANGRKAALEQYEYGQLAEKLATVLFD
ncbi:glycosyltransferase involved in cell wall biosynthesis [Marinobacter sp. 3-2]|jgi:glycosyltransferase involved in cell wall biosynthesis|uniref:glycosyltransferase family 4 protein n=1 Tax=Marinobacter sp. 3-2 TaxID=2485141 RepID=UPI000D3CE2E1|nr:glycosyltransferase family 4 protein [Marinobacter sp. 3-2]ROQ47063.1 glycosyltransferase involved in cell wall biosynthesis [Marinobacter sp. 3-2]